MKLTIDIGNTTIAFGFFKEENLVNVLTIDTNIRRTYDQYLSDLRRLLEDAALKNVVIEEAIISSVVPVETNKIARIVKALFAVDALVLGPGLKTGLALKVDSANEVGADLVAVSVGALKFYEAPFLIVDLGTVNKYIYIDEKNHFVGVSFTPGIMMSKDALDRNTALLMQVAVEEPTRILGKNTKDALNSGLVFGTIAQIRGLVDMIRKEVKKDFKVIITGGNSIFVKDALINEDTKHFIYNDRLIHYGLLQIINKNVRA